MLGRSASDVIALNLGVRPRHLCRGTQPSLAYCRCHCYLDKVGSRFAQQGTPQWVKTVYLFRQLRIWL
jgi:hypothetical protein